MRRRGERDHVRSLPRPHGGGAPVLALCLPHTSSAVLACSCSMSCMQGRRNPSPVRNAACGYACVVRTEEALCFLCLSLQEYGTGRYAKKHSTFFATMMAELGLSTKPEAYLDLVPWQVCCRHRPMGMRLQLSLCVLFQPCDLVRHSWHAGPGGREPQLPAHRAAAPLPALPGRPHLLRGGSCSANRLLEPCPHPAVQRHLNEERQRDLVCH